MCKLKVNLLGYPRCGTTYFRFILACILKTTANQPEGNIDPIFKNFPLDISNKEKILFTKYHFAYEIRKNINNNKNIFIVSNPIDSIKRFQNYKYNNNQTYNKDIINSIEWKLYWDNINYIDKIKDVCFITFNEIIDKDRKHDDMINNIILYLNIEDINYNKNEIFKIYNDTCNSYRYNTTSIKDYFDRNKLIELSKVKINKLNNIELKNLLYETINN